MIVEYDVMYMVLVTALSTTRPRLASFSANPSSFLSDPTATFGGSKLGDACVTDFVGDVEAVSVTSTSAVRFLAFAPTLIVVVVVWVTYSTEVAVATFETVITVVDRTVD